MDDSTLVWVEGIVILLLVIAWIKSRHDRSVRSRALQHAYARYREALKALRRAPTDQQLLLNVLSLGQVYADLSSKHSATPTYLNEHLHEDIAAATAASGNRPYRPVKERLAELEEVWRRHNLTRQQYEERRAMILDDL